FQLGHSGEAVTKAYLDPAICENRRQVDLLPQLTLPVPDAGRQMLLF
ncbi:MAG: hypothetical protein IMZ54_12580, partial [Acidobacteria bacterium]|nr:hypothetical protein [Acidobacteriota bacterium]